MTLKEELARLMGATTPGTWRVDGEQKVVSSELSPRSRKIHVSQPPMGVFSSAGRDQNRDNALFVAYVHNNMPDLLAKLDRIEDLERALENLLMSVEISDIGHVAIERGFVNAVDVAKEIL